MALAIAVAFPVLHDCRTPEFARQPGNWLMLVCRDPGLGGPGALLRSHRPQISPSLVLGPERMQPVLWARGTPGSSEGLTIGTRWLTVVERFLCASSALTQGVPTNLSSWHPWCSVIFHSAPRLK